MLLESGILVQIPFLQWRKRVKNSGFVVPTPHVQLGRHTLRSYLPCTCASCLLHITNPTHRHRSKISVRVTVDLYVFSPTPGVYLSWWSLPSCRGFPYVVPSKTVYSWVLRGSDERCLEFVTLYTQVNKMNYHPIDLDNRERKKIFNKQNTRKEESFGFLGRNDTWIPGSFRSHLRRY